MNEKAFAPSSLNFISSPDGSLVVRLIGDWKMENQLSQMDEVEKNLRAETRV